MKIEDSISYTLMESSQFLNVSVNELRGYIKANRISVKHNELADRIPGKELNRFLEELNKTLNK